MDDLQLDDTEKNEVHEERDPDVLELTEKILQLGIYPLAMISLHPIKSKLIHQKMMGAFFSTLSGLMTYWTIKYIFVYSIDIAILAQLISSFGLYTLAQLKVIPLIYFNDVIQRLLKNKKRFWNYGNDPELKQQVLQIYSNGYNYGRVWYILVLNTLFLYMARPLYDKGALLTLHWYADGYYIHALCYQMFYAFFLVALVLGFNGLFYITIFDVWAQFRILNWMIQNYQNNGSNEDIRKLMKFVVHHRFLLKCVKDIEKVFMIQILALYILTIASCCMELYTITETPTKFSDKARSLLYIVTLLVQLATFCFPAGELTNEIFQFSQSLYLCNWEQGSRALQTWLPFAIMSTQQVIDFKAMGLVTINKMAFVDVAKSTMSFLTLMRNMK